MVWPWCAGAAEVMPAAPAVAPVPWADMADRPVLKVERVADLKALLTIESLLRRVSVRLLAVGRSEAWFVADSLPERGWAGLLQAEPRLQPAGEADRSPPEGLHATFVWAPEAAAVALPDPAP